MKDVKFVEENSGIGGIVSHTKQNLPEKTMERGRWRKERGRWKKERVRSRKEKVELVLPVGESISDFGLK